MAYTINTNETSLSFDSVTNGKKETITVIVDGSDDNNSYYISDTSEYSWFTIERNRNTLTICAKPNFSTEERVGYITCVHNLDIEVSTSIEIHQKSTEYTLNVSVSDIFFPGDKETNMDVNVDVGGGSEDYYIKSIKQYNRENFGDEDVEVEYDNGLVLSKRNEDGKKILNILSYGRIFVDKGNFYKIILAHKDNRFVEEVITIIYKDRKGSIKKMDDITFTYDGKLKNDTDTREIIFNDVYDYGYEIVNKDELNKVEWLNYTENPTSLTISVDINGSQEKRETTINVKYSDDDIEGSFKVTQEPFNGFEITLSDDILFFEKDETGTFEVTFKIYGVYGVSDNDNVFSNISVVTTTDKWCSKKNNGIVRDIKGILFNHYTVTFEIKNKNTAKDKREATIIFTHPQKADVKSELKIIQYGTEEDENTISNISNTGDTIIVNTNPEDSQIVAQSTAIWCEITINGHNITVKCEENLWNVTRLCKIMVQNAEVPNKTLYYTVQQAKGTNFSISFDS